MRVLITGIAGFAGSHLAEHLLTESDTEIWGVVRGEGWRIAHLEGPVTLRRGDLRDPQFCRRLLEEARPQHLYHLAAQAFVPSSWVDPWGTLEANLRPQINLLTAVLELGLRPRALVLGSNEEYGAVRPEELPIREETPLRPDSPYGVSKVAQDLLGLQYHLSHGLEIVRVRPFNHVGLGQREHFVVPALAQQIAEIEAGLRPPVVRVGNLEAQRDFTDVRDMVRAYALALTQGLPGEVYNIGSGVTRSIRQVLEALLAFSSARISIEVDPTRLRPSDVPVSVCDYNRFRERTGWDPRIPWEQTLGDVLQEWRERVSQRERG